MYCKAVWVKDGRETEGTLPVSWVDLEKGLVMWPKHGATKAYRMKEEPQEEWMAFKLVEIKMTSGKPECERYSQTSHAEEDEEQKVRRGRRKPSKRKFVDFVQLASDEEGEECKMGSEPSNSEYIPEICPEEMSNHEGFTVPSQHTFPLPTGVFQKAVLDLLTDIRNEVRRVGRTELSSSVTSVKVETMESMEEFQRQEELLFDEEAFNALVLQLSRIGGKDTKDCVHKVLDRLLSNGLMAKFNLKGQGKKEKVAFEKTHCCMAVLDAVMKADPNATERAIKQYIADHLKDAPARRGGREIY